MDSLYNEIDLSDDDFDEPDDYVTDSNFRICPPKQRSGFGFGLKDNKQLSQVYYKDSTSQIYNHTVSKAYTTGVPTPPPIDPSKVLFPPTVPTTLPAAVSQDHTVPWDNNIHPHSNLPSQTTTFNTIQTSSHLTPIIPQAFAPISVPTYTNTPPQGAVPSIPSSTVVASSPVIPPVVPSPTLPASTISAQTVPATTAYAQSIPVPAVPNSPPPTTLVPTVPIPNVSAASTPPSPAAPTPQVVAPQAAPSQTITPQPTPPQASQVTLSQKTAPSHIVPSQVTPSHAPATPALPAPVTQAPTSESTVPAHFTGANKVYLILSFMTIL
jgi:hypothetical protein